MEKPWGRYTFWLVGCCLFFGKPIVELIGYALENSDASHILLIPFIVAWLVFAERQKVLSSPLDLVAALWFVLPALLLSGIALEKTFENLSDSLTVTTLALVLLLIAGFVGLFGRASAKAMQFPLAFLLFLVPLPKLLLDRVIYWLQAGSADVADVIFEWSGAPVLRQGFIFHLPKMSIEVASECSGIRSSIALLILALLVAHFSFTKLWKKILFTSVGIFLMIVKNGIRIATLTLLANYVNPGFLYGHLHRDGGIVFFLIGLALLWPVFWWLRKGEIGVSPSFETSTPR